MFVMSTGPTPDEQRDFRMRNDDLVETAERRLNELGEHALSPSETLLLYNAGVLRKTDRAPSAIPK